MVVIPALVSSGTFIIRNYCPVQDVLALAFISFALCIYFPSEHNNGGKCWVLGIYTAFLLISLIPVVVDAIDLSRGPEDQYHKWGVAIFFGLHSLCLNYIVTLLAVIAVYSQACKFITHPSSVQAFSTLGLTIQAAAFIAVAVSWVFRVSFSVEGWQLDPWTLHFWNTWYQLVGWAAVDNIIFGLGQVVLLCLVTRRSGWETGTSETQPLLRG